jgi:hypothetical protein
LRPAEIFDRKAAMTINSVLFQNNAYLREPALLEIGRSQNYQSLADYLSSQESQETSAGQAADKVDLALDKVAGKMLSEVAALTAEVIKDYPEFQNDYVLAVIDGGNGSREARVFSRAEILASFEGSETEKAQLAESLAKNPLIFYTSAENLPASSQSEAAQSLQTKVSGFLSSNQKLLDMLSKYGFNPFETAES